MTEQGIDAGAASAKPLRSLAGRRAAAKAAVAASRKTGRPVDERVRKLAESKLGEYDPAQP
jgi:hypothetical protein